MIISILATFLAAALFTEIAGYFIHILLHSNKVEFLSRNHMIHHLRVYKPKQTMRLPGSYQGSTEGRASLDGIGVEWLAPIAGVLAIFFTFAWAVGMPGLYQALFIAVSLLWGRQVFGIMHDAMHLQNFWMLKNRFTRAWFLEVRRLHDIHHMNFSDDGRMTKNFGICFFFVDRLLGSIAHTSDTFNEKGYAEAKRRYAYIFN